MKENGAMISTNGSIGESVRIICRENDLLKRKRQVTHLSGVNFVGRKSKPDETRLKLS